MSDSARVWIVAVLVAILALGAGFYVGRKADDGGGTTVPPPGDIIIVHPEPNDPDTASAHWTIGGDAPVVQTESASSNWLNSTAFGQVLGFYGQIQPSSGAEVLVDATELSATFKHCADKPELQCDSDSVCSASSGGTCISSKVRVTVDTSTPAHFRWFLTRGSAAEIELVSHDYGNSKKWRAELCGKLTGDILVTGKLRSNASIVVNGKLLSSRSFTMQAQP